MAHHTSPQLGINRYSLANRHHVVKLVSRSETAVHGALCYCPAEEQVRLYTRRGLISVLVVVLRFIDVNALH